jgi:hypothetical protein
MGVDALGTFYSPHERQGFADRVVGRAACMITRKPK